ncbi:MAG: hypothetical protein OCD02_17200 [Spirochaetaceae bacterium]
MNENLSNNRIDVVNSAIKSTLGAVPLAGTFLGELVSAIIPNQRMDRVTDFLKLLSTRFEDIEDKCKSNLDALFLLEEGIRISAKTNNKKKREWITSIIGKGIYEEIEPNITEKFIAILEDITYEQVIILIYFHTKENNELYPTRSKLEFIYPDIIMPPAVHIRDIKKLELCQNHFDFNTSSLQNFALLRRTLDINSSFNYSFPSNYKSSTIENIIDDYRKEIFEVIENSTNKAELKITSLGSQFIDNIIYDINNIEDELK